MTVPAKISARTAQIVLLLACLLPANVPATEDDDDDFWLLLDYEVPLQNALWFYAGADELDGNYFGLAADLALAEALHFNFSATRQNYSVDTSELRWGFSGTINRYLNWQLLKIFWGKRDSLEKNDVQLASSFFYDRFNARLSYESGDVELFLRDSPLIMLESVSTDHQAYELSAGYSWPVIYSQLSFKQHDYEKDLTLLTRRPRLFRSVNPLGLQQASALAETEASMLLGIQTDSMKYEILLSRIKSAVSSQSDNYATLHLAKSLSRNLELGVDVELPVNDVPFSAGVTLGIMW